MQYKRSYKYIILLAVGGLFILFDQCVEPFVPTLEATDTVNLLVVEGLITNETGPFGIRLSSTVPVYSYRNVIEDSRPVRGAEVRIVDDIGNEYLLFENHAGWYETEEKDLKGIPGNTYTLLITTADGNQYESSPAFMQAGSDIDSLRYEELTRTYFDLEEPYEETWLNIMVDAKAPGDDLGYFKWDYEETWEFEMPGYVRVNHGTGEGSPPPSMETIDIDFEKKRCWVSESSRSILIQSTIDDPANEINGFILQSMGPPDDRLNIKYSILVRQYLLSGDMYKFFKRIRESNEETGGIYEKTPAKIIGNIQCCNGVTEALGYFIASEVKTKRIFIVPSEHKVAKGSAYGECGWTTDIPRSTPVYLYGTYDNGNSNAWSTNKYCTDCRVRGSNVAPDFWE